MSGKSKKVKGTKQTLEYVEEPKKLHVKQIKCKNTRQKEFLKCIDEHEVSICTGIPGSGKTYLAVYAALKALEKNLIEKIVLVKSVTTIPGEDIGILPGDIYDKMDPFMISFFGNIDKIIGEPERKRLVGEKKIEIQPIAYVRGINIDNAIVILDECQNVSIQTFKSVITRIGQNSKYIIMGDIEQVDMRHRDQSSLAKLTELFRNDELVGVVQFTDEDCVRNPIIPHLLDKIKTIE